MLSTQTQLWFKTVNGAGPCTVTLPNSYVDFFIKEIENMNGEILSQTEVPETAAVVRKMNYLHKMHLDDGVRRFTAGWKINDAENTIEVSFAVVSERDTHYVKRVGRDLVDKRMAEHTAGFYFKLNANTVFGPDTFKPNNTVKISDVNTKIVNHMVYSIIRSQIPGVVPYSK